jgi:F-type H+-transporting ATPase subunit b
MLRRLLGLAALLLTPAAAMAAGPEKEGMPQLDFHSPLTISQVVWMALIFAALYVLFARWGLPRVATVLEERRATIDGDLDTARAAKAQSDAAVTELTSATRSARAEAVAAVASASQQAKDEAAGRAAETNAVLDKQLHEAEGRIAEARAGAMGALRQVAAETATAVVTRLTGRGPDNAQVYQTVDRLLAARGQA